MAGFIRRYPYVPGTEVITLIEGVIVIDLTPPGAIAGVGTGVAAVVGEFSDCTYATSVDSSGLVTTKIQPIEVFTGADLVDKVGGFDETLGEFGVSMGNGYVELRNKTFRRLIAVPVNMASGKGVRYYRDLPMNASQAIAQAVVPVQGGSIVAGREFRSGTGRLRIAKRVDFTSLEPIATGTGGTVVAGGSAATQQFLKGDQATAVWQVDATPGPDVFVSMLSEFNNQTDGDVIPFPATENIGDYFAIGFSGTFDRVIFNLLGGVQGVGGTVAWEYWNGSAWTALSGVTDATAGFTAALADGLAVSFTLPTDWATTTLNSVSAYYIRARVTGVYGTNPTFSQGFIANTTWDEIERPDGTLGIHKGDILVVGYNNAGSVAPALEAGTYRVQADPSAGSVVLTVERLDGQSFAWTAQGNIPWRIHYASDADSAPVLVPGAATPGGYGAADVGGYTIPSRPLTDQAGASTDGTWTAGSVLTPAVVPTAITGSSWDPLSGLGARVMPGGGGGIAFTAAVQAVNAVASASIDALYVTALAAVLADEDPTRDINLLWAARKSSTIRNTLKTTALQKSILSAGVVAAISPPLNQTVLTTVGGDASPGVGATRSERVIYDWPGVQTFVPEAVGFRLKTADGNTTIDGIMDVTSDGWLVSACSNLAPERNPGQGAEPIPTVMSPILGIQRGVSGLDINSYVYLRSRGICAPRMDRKVGPIFQSGITSSLLSKEKNINRRRFADFIEDTVADALVPFSKLPVDANLRDGALGEVVNFLSTLLSENNPSAQRIAAYDVDDKSGNTPALQKLGVYVIIGKVEMMPMADFIVFQAQVGNGVLEVSAG